jgi:integrase
MSRKPVWPPRIHKHVSGRAFVRWKGHNHYLGKYDSAEARTAYRRLLVELESGLAKLPPKNGASVSAVVAAWFTHEAPRYSERGRERIAFRLALEPLLALYGTDSASSFDADKLETLQLAMAAGSWLSEDEKAKRRKVSNRGPIQWSRKVINQRIGRIRRVWRWAERKKLVPPGAYGALRTLPGLRANDARVRNLPKRKPATAADVERIVASAPPLAAAAIQLLWWSGMRPGELQVMRLQDVERADPGCWLYRPMEHKTEHLEFDRVIAMGPKCIAILTAWLAQLGTIDPTAYVFPGRNGARLRKDSLSQMARRAAQAAGVQGFTLYQLRHSAKDRIVKAFGLDTARAFLGQHSLGTTNEYGTQLDTEAASDAARKVG